MVKLHVLSCLFRLKKKSYKVFETSALLQRFSPLLFRQVEIHVFSSVEVRQCQFRASLWIFYCVISRDGKKKDGKTCKGEKGWCTNQYLWVFDLYWDRCCVISRLIFMVIFHRCNYYLWVRPVGHSPTPGCTLFRPNQIFKFCSHHILICHSS